MIITCSLTSVLGESICGTISPTSALQWISFQQNPSGLVSSYYPKGKVADRTYDQAIAAIAFLLNVDSPSSPHLTSAETILNAMLNRVSSTGVTFNVNVVTGAGSGAVFNGHTSRLVTAFALHWLITGQPTYSSPVITLCNWLKQLKNSNGCLRGNLGVTWCKTEFNIDSYFALKLAAYLTGDNSYNTTADAVGLTLTSTAMFETVLDVKRFQNGYNDPYRDLLAQAYGSLFLVATNASAATTAFVLDYAYHYFYASQVMDTPN